AATGFGADGVPRLPAADGNDSDFLALLGLRPVRGGYLAPVIDRSASNGDARAVTFDASGVKTVVSLATASEIMSLDSAALADGGAAVVLQVPSGTEDVDDFHVYKFLPNGTLDPDFDD